MKAVVLCVVAGLVSAASGSSVCQWSHSDTSTTFDLSPLSRAPADAYVVEDALVGTDPNKAYKFKINVCNNSSRPDTGAVTNPCEAGPFPSSPAYQFGSGPVTQGNCYQLASPFTEPEFSLLDPTNPARGVIYRMGHGEPCADRPGVTRYMELHLACSPGNRNNIPDVENVVTWNSCQHRLSLPSHYGCPTECMEAPDADICSNKGVCGYNTDTHKSMCFCNDGYEGAVCEKKSSSGNGGLSTEASFLIVACLLLAFVITLTVYMFIKLRKLQVDPNAYGELQGRFNELGQMM